jgi:hypothetical protein
MSRCITSCEGKPRRFGDAALQMSEERLNCVNKKAPGADLGAGNKLFLRSINPSRIVQKVRYSFCPSIHQLKHVPAKDIFQKHKQSPHLSQ